MADSKLKKVKELLKIQGLSQTPMVIPSSEQKIPTGIHESLEIPVPTTMEDQPIEKMGNYNSNSDEPMTKVDQDEVKKRALERIKNKPNQKLNFNGGFLDRQGIYDENE